MKTISNGQKLPVKLLIFSLLVIIVGYNYWSYRCGYCTFASFLSLSAPAKILLLLIGVAGGGLLAVKFRARQQVLRQRCRCGSALRSSWSYCPNCGGARQ